MSLDRAALIRAATAQGRVARIVVAQSRGSAPREPGTSMLVWAGGESGTIGGGALEFAATAVARTLIQTGRGPIIWRQALGPDLHQCCGGSVALVIECFDIGTAIALPEGPHARRIQGAAEMPIPMMHALRNARSQGLPVPILLQDGWLIEGPSRPTRQLWIHGAGHVGRALVAVLAPMPQFAITWVDTAPERFPDAVPEGVTVLPAADPARLVAHAPREAEHLIMTYSHELDLALCHALLTRGFLGVGLIGSATKWARFRSRLAKLGHDPSAISRITCPIGNPALGKHPQAIAVGVAHALLTQAGMKAEAEGRTA